MFALWQLRPVRNETLLAEQMGFTWKLLKISPFLARRSKVGKFITPPMVLEPAYPKLSSKIMITLGAPAGAWTWNIGGAFTFRASSSVIGG